jgi:MFS family permease
VGVGIASMAGSIYIAEISPAGMRGRMVSLNQFSIIFGTLAVYFVNYFILDLSFYEPLASTSISSTFIKRRRHSAMPRKWILVVASHCCPALSPSVRDIQTGRRSGQPFFHER